MSGLSSIPTGQDTQQLSEAQHNAAVEMRIAREEMAEIEAGRFLSTGPTAQAREREVVETRLAMAVRTAISLGVPDCEVHQ